MGIVSALYQRNTTRARAEVLAPIAGRGAQPVRVTMREAAASDRTMPEYRSTPTASRRSVPREPASGGGQQGSN